MNIVSFIEPTQPDVIDAILTHCGLADEPARAPPQDTSAGELQYVRLFTTGRATPGTWES